MDITPGGLVCNWLPQLPSILKTTALSLVGQSRNSEYQDTLTETIVQSARPILQTPAALLRSQQDCNADWGIGRPWIAKYTVPRPSDDDTAPNTTDEGSTVLTIRQAVERAIRELSRSDQQHAASHCPIPDLIDVETEWTFCPPHTLPLAPHPDITERQVYTNLMRSVDPEGPTVLHLHGGAYCLMDPSTHRWALSSLARHSHGRVMSVRYRLAPQNVFPAALMDAMQAYLSLIAPPLGAFHAAVPPEKIIISGDSSGGGLAASLILLLLTLSKQRISVTFHGRSVVIPTSPCAGVSLVSPWLDLTRSLPSTIHNARFDIIAAPPLDSSSPPFPPDAIWPTSPPRAETYTTANMTTHPLVSPLAAQPHHWAGAPPVYLCTGWEGFTDEVEVLARRIYQSSPAANVTFEEWEGMPHCFMIMPWNRAGREAQSNWGRFCRNAVSEEGIKRVEAATYTSSVTYQAREVPLSDLGMVKQGSGYEREQQLDDKTVDALMDKGRTWRIGIENDLVRAWKDTLISSPSD